MALEALDNGFAIRVGGTTIIEHRADAPCLFVGRGVPSVEGERGHYEIADYVVERVALRHAEIAGDSVRLAPRAGAPWALALTVSGSGGDAAIAFEALDPTINRLWLRTPAEAGEHVWGAASNSPISIWRGRHFPLWTSEPGVGRDKSTLLTWHATRRARAAIITTPTIRSRPGQLAPLCAARRQHRLCRVRFPPSRLSRGRDLGGAVTHRALGASAFRRAGHRAVDALRPPAAFARLAAQRRDDRAEGRQ
jgi:hypothetical protein